jgi:lysophospholipase L1-like esterase
MKHLNLFSMMLAAMVGVSGCCITGDAPETKAPETKAPAKKAPAKKAAVKKDAKKAPAKKAAVKKAAPKLTVEQEIKLTTTPIQYKRHAKRHEAKKEFAKANASKIKILMLGDSITHQWEYPAAKAAKAKYLDPYSILNLGCGGDRTQHTLWIIEKSGILELIKPQLVTIMIGTNNHRNSPEATIAGIKLIVEKVRARYPEAKILLYAIFPRGADNKDWRRAVNEKVNAEIVKFCDGDKVEWVDIRKNFLTADGILEKSVMPDLLHPRNVKGYSIWGESLKPYFEKYGK